MAKNNKATVKEATQKHHASYIPMLSIEERNRRWLALRDSMNIEGLDCLLFVANDMRWGAALGNVRYVTQIGSYCGTYAVFPMNGEPVVWADMSHQHIPSSRYCFTQNWVQDIRPDSGPPPVVAYLKEKGYDRKAIGLVGANAAFGVGDIIPYGTVTFFQKELPNARLADGTPLVNRVRMIKSPEEISMMEKAGEIAHKVIETCIASAEPGKTEAEVFADMVHTQIASGGEAQVFIMLTSGPAEGPGNNKQLLHGDHQPTVPTMRVLQKGDLLMFEMHTFYGGYVSSCEFTLSLGKAPAPLKRIHDVAIKCLEGLQGAMRPGITVREALEAQRRPCLEAGMDYVELGFHEHGVISGGPISAAYKPGMGRLSGDTVQDLQIHENMAFATNIDIHDPKWKIDVGIQFGDTLHTIGKGSRCLVNTPRDIFEKKV